MLTWVSSSLATEYSVDGKDRNPEQVVLIVRLDAGTP